MLRPMSGGKSRRVAEHCGVSKFLVRSILGKTTSIKTKSATRTDRDGLAINTAKIGKASRKSGLRVGITDKHVFEPVLGHSNPVAHGAAGRRGAVAVA